MRLKDKVAIVTGGAAGIGKSFITAFAKEGAKVVIADVNLDAARALADTLKKESKETLTIKTDVSSPEDTLAMAEATIKSFGRIDILVNNAAVYMRVKASRLPVWELSIDEWKRVIDVNLNGVFLCSRAVLPYMIKQKSGKIINIGACHVFSGAINFAHYASSKGGVISLTRSLAREAGDYNINVNCIAPGDTLSEDSVDSSVIEFRSKGLHLRALKRIGYPADIAGTAIFLASSDSDFITGQTIVVDGGVIMH